MAPGKQADKIMVSFPNAKINLGLHVTGKRPDGYHNLETVFYPIRVTDVLEICDAASTSCAVNGLQIPDNGDNICEKAFRLLARDHDITPQKITLTKNIPIGAGLGGGSADAAFMLKMLNDRFNLQLTPGDLEAYAKELGADCPFFIRNSPVYAVARGDEFSPIHVDLTNFYIVLIKPPVHISTQEAYAGINPKPPVVPLSELIKLPVSQWKNSIVNDFEAGIFLKYPQIMELKTFLYAQGAIFAQMSGSGSSVFGLFKDPVKFSLPPGHAVFYNV